MARQESDREDLLAEARNLIERASLILPGETEELVAGFRRAGSLAIFFSPQQVYQFTSRGELRRAFVDDVLYKAQHRKLVAMRRERVEGAVHLLSRELTPETERDFLGVMQSALERLQQAMRSGATKLVGQVPPAADVPGRLLAWLDEFSAKIKVAQSPRAQ